MIFRGAHTIDIYSGRYHCSGCNTKYFQQSQLFLSFSKYELNGNIVKCLLVRIKKQAHPKVCLFLFYSALITFISSKSSLLLYYIHQYSTYRNKLHWLHLCPSRFFHSTLSDNILLPLIHLLLCSQAVLYYYR